MPKLKVFALACALAHLPNIAMALSAHYDTHQDLVALGGLSIGDTLYDVSFNQAFGTTLPTTIGLDPLQAIQAIADTFNQKLASDPRNKWVSFPTLANESQRFVEVAITPDRAYLSGLAAGWWCCSNIAAMPGDFASFRIAIPGSIPNTPLPSGFIPEPSTPLLALLGLGVVLALVPGHLAGNRKGADKQRHAAKSQASRSPTESGGQ
ncbi:MAG: PEP-CTERM sorting domain-containing protein [Aquabacterium sp.]